MATHHDVRCATFEDTTGTADCTCGGVGARPLPVPGPVFGMPPEKAQALHEYEQATVALRDAELAMRACQTRYRAALQRLNEAIAPIPADPA